MDILADENLPGRLITLLRGDGHDVWSVREQARGIPDEEVLARAIELRRILLTQDKGFGRLLFSRGHPPPKGVVLLCLSAVDYHARRERARQVLNTDLDFEGRFTVIEPEVVRIRPLLRVLGNEE